MAGVAAGFGTMNDHTITIGEREGWGESRRFNLVLASQTLAGQTTLLSSTKSQIPIRIVLQCSESDSTSVLSPENDEARLLERPGEAIYNSANGRREGNNRFQVSWLSDEALESLLDKINAHASQEGFTPSHPQVIFDGNSMADIHQNNQIGQILEKRIVPQNKGVVSAWLGEPIEMKESTAAVFKRQSRSNLFILGQSEYEQSCVSMLISSGALHKSIQERIQTEARRLGFQADVEKQLHKGANQAADLVVQCGETAIAVEIAISTSVDHEFQNVQKCLTAGFARLAVITPRAGRLEEIEAAVKAGLGPEAAAKVSYHTADDFIDHLQKLAAEIKTKPATPTLPGERVSHGLRVRRHAPQQTHEERQSKEDMANRIMAGAMRRE